MKFGASILACDGLLLTSEEAALFKDTRPFGFILFARNIDTPDQVSRLCDEFREAAGHDAVITVDQEGGRVQRLRAPHWREWLPPLEHAAFGARAMYLRARIMADELRGIGIDSNCAPTLDVAGPQTHPFLYNRCLGTTPEQVAEMGRASADGFLDGGVLPVIKHMPGHGAAAQDSHFDLARVADKRAVIEARDFAPFKALNDVALGMTAHLVYEALDDAPATQSAKMIGLIREEIGFDGLLMTDDISMQALSGTLAQRARASLAAGCDVILHCNDTLAERCEVAQAAGEMTEAAQRRAEQAMAARKEPDQIDISALEDELEALLAKG